MTRLLSHVTGLLGRLWQTDALLTGTGVLLLAALVGALIGLAVDPRAIAGSPAWLKPAKFAISTAIYTLTLAWVFQYLTAWPRTRRLVGRTTAVTLGLEVVIIYAQAGRGTTSHFNVGTPLDLTLWIVMGAAITVQTLASLAVVVALWRQVFADHALAWALRLGLSITVIGAAMGGLMGAPTELQMVEARTTQRMPVAGAHTVGGPDGGLGLPGTGWSTEHGDLRVPHFVGLHALQVLPILALTLSQRRWPEALRVRLTLTGAASYVALFAILLWQALRGQSVTHPDVATLGTLATWLALTAGTVGIAVMRSTPHRARTETSHRRPLVGP